MSSGLLEGIQELLQYYTFYSRLKAWRFRYSKTQNTKIIQFKHQHECIFNCSQSSDSSEAGKLPDTNTQMKQRAFLCYRTTDLLAESPNTMQAMLLSILEKT